MTVGCSRSDAVLDPKALYSVVSEGDAKSSDFQNEGVLENASPSWSVLSVLQPEFVEPRADRSIISADKCSDHVR